MQLLPGMDALDAVCMHEYLNSGTVAKLYVRRGKDVHEITANITLRRTCFEGNHQIFMDRGAPTVAMLLLRFLFALGQVLRTMPPSVRAPKWLQLLACFLA